MCSCCYKTPKKTKHASSENSKLHIANSTNILSSIQLPKSPALPRASPLLSRTRPIMKSTVWHSARMRSILSRCIKQDFPVKGTSLTSLQPLLQTLKMEYVIHMTRKLDQTLHIRIVQADGTKTLRERQRSHENPSVHLFRWSLAHSLPCLQENLTSSWKVL